MNEQTRAAFRGNFHATFGELCRQFDLPKTTVERHKICEWILGYRKSSSAWTGKEYSLVIDQLKDWIRGDIEPQPLTKQQHAKASFDQDKVQLIHAIESLDHPEAYIQKISNDRFGKLPWRYLGTFQLGRLNMTLKDRKPVNK